MIDWLFAHGFRAEPVVWISVVSAIVVAVLSTASVAPVVVALVPLIAAQLTRLFTTPDAPIRGETPPFEA